jgi:peroxiredoxin
MLSRIWQIGVVVVLLVIGLASGVLLAGQFNEVVDIGASMPSFENLPATDGSKLSSTDIDEEVVVLVFLANHCPWVKGMDGDLVELVDSLGARDVRVVGVSVNHREEDRLPAMVKHAAAAGYNFTYVFDESQDLGRQLGATRTPSISSSTRSASSSTWAFYTTRRPPSAAMAPSITLRVSPPTSM